MANEVYYKARPDVEPLFMSNGLTYLFVGVMSLAASACAASERQRELAAWFASRDQAVYGCGIVGFDLSDLPWLRDTFESDRDFVLRAVDQAKARLGWERLPYEPNEEMIQPCLDHFRAMVEALQVEHACMATEEWSYGGRPTAFERCPVHGVYRHSHGCPLCNDAA